VVVATVAAAGEKEGVAVSEARGFVSRWGHFPVPVIDAAAAVIAARGAFDRRPCRWRWSLRGEGTEKGKREAAGKFNCLDRVFVCWPRFSVVRRQSEKGKNILIGWDRRLP